MPSDLSGGLSDNLEFVFESQPENPEMRESVNAWIWDAGSEFGIPRIGVEAVADQWETHDVQVNLALADGRVLNMFGPGPVHDPMGSDGRPRILGAGPLSFELVEPFELLVLRAEGDAAVNSVENQLNGQLTGKRDTLPVQLEIALRPAVPPWTNGALRPEAKHVLDTQDEGYLMGHPWRFEQLCTATGTISVGNTTFQLNGGANRVRRQSIRREATLRGHAWQAALFPSGRGFSYIVYPERTDGKPTYNEGYVFMGDGDLVPARVVDAPWLRELVPSGESVPCVLETSQGTVAIEGQSIMSTFAIMPPDVGGGLQLNQAIVRYSWDGESTHGMMERSTAPKKLA